MDLGDLVVEHMVLEDDEERQAPPLDSGDQRLEART
jgi:hypothetical protein